MISVFQREKSERKEYVINLGVSSCRPGYSAALTGESDREGYPLSRSVATAYSLSGRVSGLNTNSTTLLSDMSYEAFGGLASEKYAAGNNLIHAMSYNNRLQPSEIKLGTSGTSDSIFKMQDGNQGTVFIRLGECVPPGK